LGFINFINLALNQDLPVILSFEKSTKSGDKEESKIAGQFKFTGKNDVGLMQLGEEIQETEHKRKKQQQRRKH